MKKNWWKEAVVYQIYPRSFKDSDGDGVGDLKGIIEKLPYLRDLGVDVLWLSPIYKSPNDDNGYDISDYRDIMTEFGTMEDFDLLLEKAHENGLKILMDLVVNHSSDEHKWFREREDFYIWRKGTDANNPPNNWGSVFGGSAWEYNDEKDMFYLHLFSKKQPDLNWENPELRKEVYDTMKFWLDKGIDGFRMDVINFISKDPAMPDGPKGENALYGDFSPYSMNGPKIHDYLKEMNKEVLSKYDIMTVGETPGVTPEDARKYVGEDREELNMVFQFEHMGIGDGEDGKWSHKPVDLVKFKQIMTKWQKGLEKNGWNSLYLNNHDQPRMVSRFGDTKEYWKESAKMLATCLHFMQGTPYIYQGEEIGMTNVAFETLEEYRDIETLNAYKEFVEIKGKNHEEFMEAIYAVSRDNARTPVQWSSEKNGGFTNGEPWIKANPNYKEVNVEKQLKDEDSILNYYKNLISLRKSSDIMVYGTYDLLLEEDKKVYAYTRTLDDKKLLVLCNFSKDNVEVTIDELVKETHMNLLISNYKEKIEKECKRFHLRPYEASVYMVK